MVAPSATPALLKTRFTLPWSATTWSAHSNTAARSATSTRCDVTFTPRPSHCATVSASPTSSTSLSARWVPRPARFLASARPMPDPAPVIAATRPSNCFTSSTPLQRGGHGNRGRGGNGRVGEHHRLVLDTAHLEGPVVLEIALVHLPRELRALLGELVGRAGDVARVEPEQRRGNDLGVAVDGRGLAESGLAHVVEQPGHVV